jgi:pimeloyl-ACP methyl ester carboxylesterase
VPRTVLLAQPEPDASNLAARPGVLLLHGQPGAGRDWHAVLAALGEQVRALAPDRPGWDPDSDACDLAGNARTALRWLDQLGPRPAIIVGHSLGAAIAALTALLAPERVGGLVLAAPAANSASLSIADHWLALPGAGALTSGLSLAGLGLVLSTSPLRRRLGGGRRVPEDYLRVSGRALMGGRARRAFMVEQRALVREVPNLEPRLGDIEAPTTILTGTADRIVPARAPRRLVDQIPGARLIEIVGAGHLLPQLHAREVADAVLQTASALGLPSRPARSRPI